LYNETLATEFFRSIEGVNYGFPTILTGWIDTYMHNFPCLPNSHPKRGLAPQLIDILFTIVESVEADAAIIWK